MKSTSICGSKINLIILIQAKSALLSRDHFYQKKHAYPRLQIPPAHKHMFLPPIFTLPLSCLIDFMPVHEKDPGFHLLCLYSQRNTKFSCALTLLTEIIPKFSSLLLLQEMLKSHFQLNLTWSSSRGMKKISLCLNYEAAVL